MPSPAETADLLQLWYGGDASALTTLLERHLAAVRSGAHRWLNKFPQLRTENETLDLVHDAVLRVLRYGPRFIPESGAQFEALLVRFVRNRLFNQARAVRGRGAEARGLVSPTLLDLRPSSRSTDNPGRAVEKAEERAWVEMAIEFLEDEDRELFLMRSVDGTAWEDVGAVFGMDKDAARMRFERIKPKLMNLVRRLQEGQIPELTFPLN